MTNIDRADWHYGGTYPKDLPPENGGTHIGIYLAWIIRRDLGSKQLKEYAGEKLDALRRREITGRDLLFSELDEKFFPTLLTKEGRSFTHDYYESQQYLNDYDRILGGDLETLYHVADSWANYDKIEGVLDERLAAWRRDRRAVEPG